MFATKSLTTILLAAASVLTAPTKTTRAEPSTTVTLTGVTHSVVAGRGAKLVFDPENVVAQVGDVVEWHFLPRNHSVAQSNFAQPCQPGGAASPFFSGFVPVAQGQAADVFQIVVEDDSRPIWYYCAQQAGNHCQSGMAGVINQNFDGPNTLAAYKRAAAGTGTSVIPPAAQGGKFFPNPNPLSGF